MLQAVQFYRMSGGSNQFKIKSISKGNPKSILLSLLANGSEMPSLHCVSPPSGGERIYPLNVSLQMKSQIPLIPPPGPRNYHHRHSRCDASTNPILALIYVEFRGHSNIHPLHIGTMPTNEWNVTKAIVVDS